MSPLDKEAPQLRGMDGEGSVSTSRCWCKYRWSKGFSVYGKGGIGNPRLVRTCQRLSQTG